MSSYGELGAFKALAGCSDPLAANNCGTCLLWRKLRGGYTTGPLTSLPCTPLEHCFSTMDGEHTVMSTGSGIPGKDPGHFLVLPGSKTKEWAVYGIEDPVVLSAEGEQFWDVAWSAAFEPYTTIPASAGSVPHLPVAASPSDIGLGLNPASGRSMHQLHIHMARIPRPVREAFRGGGSETFKDWTQVTVQLTGSRLSGQSVALYGRYYPAASFGGTVSALDPFRQVFAFSGYDAIKMQAWGMMLLPDEATSSSSPSPGVYVVVGAHHDPWDREVAWWNHYPDNPHMIPEYLLCVDASLQEGFWAAEDCPPLGLSLPEDSLAAPGKRRGAIP